MADQDFEWMAEEEQVPLSRRPGEQDTTAGWRGLLRRRPVILLLLLAVLGAGLYWAFQRYYGNPALAKAEVEATHLLVREAVLLQDAEQFAQLLSDEDETWAAAQQALVAEQAWLRREGLGLHWQRSLSPATAVTLTNSTDTAQIVTAETYTRTLADGRAQQVTFYHTAHYRPGADGWLLAPPDSAFWGEQQVIEESHLRLLYPARDAALAPRLAADLNEWVRRSCTQLDLDCPADYRLGVELSADPGTLSKMPPAGPTLLLPTPTLAGLPASEAAYTALVEGYGREVVGAAVADLLGWACCRGGAFFEALVDVQRRELGLPVPALRPADYARLVREKVEPSDLYGLWAFPPAGLQPLTRNRVRAVVGFLQEWEPETTVTEWLRRLVAAGDYRDWAGRLAEGPLTFRARAAWLGYLHSHAGLADNETKNLPEEDVLLLCYDPAEREPDFRAGQWLLRYDPEREELRPEMAAPTLPGAMLLAQSNDDPVLAQGLLAQRPATLLSGLAERRLEMSVVGAGTEPIFETSFGDGLSWVQPSPQGNYLFVGVYNPAANASAIHLLDVMACRQGDCEMTWLADLNALTAAWAPDEQHFFWQQTDGLYVAAVPDLTAQKVAPAPDTGYYELFWLDNETYGYFHFQNSSPAARPFHWIEPIVATIHDPRPGPLYNAEDLLSLLPEYGEAPGRATLIPNPADANQPYVVLEFWGASTSHVLSFNRDTREVQPLLELDPNAALSLMPSPDGRWLAYGGPNQLFVYDAWRERMVTLDTFVQLSQFRWTPDSEWLLGLGENTLAVAAPQSGDLQLKIDAQLNCTQAIWAADEG